MMKILGTGILEQKEYGWVFTPRTVLTSEQKEAIQRFLEQRRTEEEEKKDKAA